jgi:hypothetical protein
MILVLVLHISFHITTLHEFKWAKIGELNYTPSNLRALFGSNINNIYLNFEWEGLSLFHI